MKPKIFFVRIFLRLLLSLISTSNLFASCSTKTKYASLCPETLIPQSFIRTVSGCGFDSLNTWQQFNRILWNLDYIGWKEDCMENVDNITAVWSCDSKNGVIECKMDKTSAPYQLEGHIETEDTELPKLNYTFTNHSPETIKSFNLIFFIFDEDGNPPNTGRNTFTLSICQEILPGETIEDFASLADYMYIFEENEFFIDYLYASRIEYKNGSVWTDPFGRKYFN